VSAARHDSAADLRVAIECARARGWALERICREYGIHAGTVVAVFAAQDALNSEPDTPAPPGARHGRPRIRGCGTRAGYWWHRNHGQTPCGPCMGAATEHADRSFSAARAAS
jgi:hypothetical protein